MAMIAVQISSDISRLLKDVDVECERDNSDHITMFYFEDDLSIKKVCKMLPLIFDITSNHKPFEASLSKISAFPEGKHGYPIIAEVQSKELHELREQIAKAFDKANIKYDQKFPEYLPHITLGYSEEKLKTIKLPKFKFSITNISLYYGDISDTKLFINFPFTFGLDAVKKAHSASSTFLKCSSII